MVHTSFQRLSNLTLLLSLLMACCAGCCCQPTACNDCGPGFSGNGGHLAGMHRHELRKGTLPHPVPAPAVAAPIARYHPLPTHPVFEPQAHFAPLVSIDEGPQLAPLAPTEPQSPDEPTPANLPEPSTK